MCYGPIEWKRHRGYSALGVHPDYIKKARFILGKTENGTCTDVVIQFSGARSELLSKAVAEFLREKFTELEIR